MEIAFIDDTVNKLLLQKDNDRVISYKFCETCNLIIKKLSSIYQRENFTTGPRHIPIYRNTFKKTTA